MGKISTSLCNLNKLVINVSFQIEVLSPKQNGSTVDSSSHDTTKAHNKASIKGMWKKAFKSLKTDSKGSTKDKEEKLDRQESKYSRMVSVNFSRFKMLQNNF